MVSYLALPGAPLLADPSLCEHRGVDCFICAPGSSTVTGMHYGKLAAMKQHYELAQRLVDRVLSQSSQAREATAMQMWYAWFPTALDLGTTEPFRYVLPTPRSS